MRKRPKRKKPQLKVSINMPADDVVDAMKTLKIRFLKEPEEVGQDENGKIVHWFLPSMTLTLKRRVVQRVECYRVVEIEPIDSVKPQEVEAL